MGMPFDGNTLKTQSLGGSETAALYLARELAKLGHEVECWTNGTTSALIDGVRYTPNGAVTPETPLGQNFHAHATVTPHDVLIIQRHPLAFHSKWAAKLCLWQTHDLALHHSTSQVWQGLWQLDAVTCVSEWHKAQTLGIYGLKPDAVHVIPNGVDASLYSIANNLFEPAQKVLAATVDGKVPFLYQSRPERGLEFLVRPDGIMAQLADTRAHLFFCSYQNTQPQMAGYYAMLQQMAAVLPNVTDLGALTKAELAQVQQQCTALAYPSEFEEVSCITVMECMQAGLPILASDVGALAETCRDAGAKLIPLKDKRCDVEEFVRQMRKIASGDSGAWLRRMQQQQLEAAPHYTWKAAAGKLNSLLYELLAKYHYDPLAVTRYGFEHSDLQLAVHGIHACKSAHDETPERELELYDFAQSPAKYAAHYAKHQGIYYDDHEESVIGEDVTGTTRFRGVMTFMSMKQDANDGEPMRVLDYGCAHGHYLMPFAKWMPKSIFYGVDISQRAIGAALKWATRDGIKNVVLGCGMLEQVEEWGKLRQVPRLGQMDATTGEGSVEVDVLDERFDVILAGEVLEHVPDPVAVIERLRKCLKPNGWLIATTPVGRWEWTGTSAFKEAREHLWHFSKHDLEYLLKDFEHQVLYAPAGVDRTGGVLGSYVWRLEQDEAVDFINLPPIAERVNLLAPRQRLSACLIVKNGEKALRRCVESFVDWVDEVVIAIDPTTTDRTRQIVEQLQADSPLRSFVVLDGLSASADGFAAARNVTLDAASGDWILWVDADEEVQQPWNLWKFLKPSPIDAVGMPQIHYSCNPPQVLTTDHPNRLFRKASGARFYGYVHEHPEVEQGKSIPYTLLRGEVQFLHSGYVDEETRRKRFDRNMPLLKRDLLENPDRVLNRFLAVRDLAQGAMFTMERNGGQLTPELVGDLNKCVETFEAALDLKLHPRMVTDALQYYSGALAILHQGFEAEVALATAQPPYPDLTVSTTFKGRFRNREVYLKLITRVTEEATKFYDSKYL